jgi:hypothetical protein
MTLTLELPRKVLDALGTDPQREVLEALLLKLILEDRLTVAQAGYLLGLSRHDAILWYTSHGLPYLDYDEDDLANELSYAERDGRDRS